MSMTLLSVKIPLETIELQTSVGAPDFPAAKKTEYHGVDDAHSLHRKGCNLSQQLLGAG